MSTTFLIVRLFLLQYHPPMSDPIATGPIAETASAEKKNYVPLSEIQKHTTTDDMWMAVNGKVYNVTSFVDQHPGGEEVLLEHAGTDATVAFEDVGHSENAVEMLDDLYVGDGNPEELTVVAKKESAGLGETSEGSSNNLILFIICALVAGVAFFYYKAMKE